MASCTSSFLERDRLGRDIYDVCAKSPEGADLLISAFVGALRSYRRASVCAPFPGFLFDNDRNKDFKSATEFVAHFPAIKDVVSSGYGGSEGALNPVQHIPLQALMLLHWILQFRYHVQLVQDRNEISGLRLSDTPGMFSKQDMTSDKSILPSQVLEVRDMDEHSTVIKVFQAAKDQHGSIMAFHGTTAESLHSILRCGLLNMSKTHLQRNGAVFGEGVYLSTDLGVASTFCKSGDTWENSCFGPRVRYVLLCEVAKGKGVTFSTPDLQRKEKHPVQKSGTEIHGTYVVVANSALIRIRFVLVYGDYTRDLVQSHRNAEVTHPTDQALTWKNAVMKGVCSLDWFSFVILFYVALLLIVGFSKSGVKASKSSVMLMKQLSLVVDRLRVWIDSWTTTPYQ